MSNLLFVASGRRYSLIEAFKKEAQTGDRIVLADSEGFVPTRVLADSFHKISPWSYESDFVNEIEDVVDMEEIDAIISLMDPATRILFSTDIPKRTQVLCSSYTTNLIAASKQTTTDFFLSCGVETPSIVSPYEDGYYIVARPVHGYGSRSTHIFSKKSKERFLEDYQKTIHKYIFTRQVWGTEFTVDCFKDQFGEVTAIIPRERVEVRNGEVQKCIVRTDQDRLIAELKEKILPRLPFVGVVCIQVIQTNMGVNYFIEINDRFGGGTPISFLAGANMPQWIWKILHGEAVEPIQSFSPLHVARCDREIILDGINDTH